MLERMHLAIVQEVEKQGSLTAAANVLCLTQSALSHSMRKLEQQLGTDIWLREGRTLRLTQAGQYVLAVANRVLPQLTLAEERLRQFAQGERGTLRIGMECHPCYQWLLKVVSPYLAAWPDVDVDVKQKFQFGGIGALFGYEIDLLVTPDPLFKPGLHFEPVFDYEQVLVVGRDHPLARADQVEPQDLLDEVLITYPVSRDKLDIFTELLTPAKVEPRGQRPVELTAVILMLVGSNRGVAVLPDWVIRDLKGNPDYITRPLAPGNLTRRLYACLREDDAARPHMAHFVRLGRTEPVKLQRQ